MKAEKPDDHKTIALRFFRVAELFGVSLLLALILLECGSYILNSLNAFTPSAAPASVVDYLKKPNWSEETAIALSETSGPVAINRQSAQSFYHYESFIGWRSGKRSGRMINIDDDGNRITDNLSGRTPTTVLDFYGGSTIWGFGVSDANTIPSRFARIAKTALVRNFGGEAYNSRQELNFLLNNATRGRIGNVVIFYDGVNDVIFECQRANGPFGDAFTGIIRSVLARIAQDGRIRNLVADLDFRNKIALILPNTTTLIERLTGRGLGRDVYLNLDQDNAPLCGDPEVANLVAENLVRNWEVASLVAKNYNATFFAILQPNPYTADIRQPYYKRSIDDVTKAVYPLIKSKAGGFSWFIDGTSWLNGRTDLYIDVCCHLNEKGNEIIAQDIFCRIGDHQSDLEGKCAGGGRVRE